MGACPRAHARSWRSPTGVPAWHPSTWSAFSSLFTAADAARVSDCSWPVSWPRRTERRSSMSRAGAAAASSGWYSPTRAVGRADERSGAKRSRCGRTGRRARRGRRARSPRARRVDVEPHEPEDAHRLRPAERATSAQGGALRPVSHRHAPARRRRAGAGRVDPGKPRRPAGGGHHGTRQRRVRRAGAQARRLRFRVKAARPRRAAQAGGERHQAAHRTGREDNRGLRPAPARRLRRHGATARDDHAGCAQPGSGAHLRRVVQEKTVRPIGEPREESVDVRILSATHKNLGDLVAQGLFREDLFYRINVIELRVPALRERSDDIPEIAEAILTRLARRMNATTPKLSAETVQTLQAYRYPGNVRELENVLERALTLSTAGSITPEHIRLRTGAPPAAAEPPAHVGPPAAWGGAAPGP